MKKNYLLTPGPTPIPPEVLKSQAQPIIHHRTPQFEAILKEAEEGLKYVFQTKNEVLIFASSGTGAMEAAVVNLLSPGEEAICIRGGKFGERWTELCEVYGIRPLNIDVEWGKSVDVKIVEEKLNNSNAKVVFATLCETSTGVTADVKALAEAAHKKDAVLVVDAISALGAVECKTDEWDMDVVIAGSQKGLMLPPGLGFASVSERAWKFVEQSKSPRYYFDFRSAKKNLAKNTTPFTPAITLIIGLNESLKLIKKEGLDNAILRFKRLSQAVREAMEALGLELFAPDAYSDAVTAIKVPEGVDGGKLVKIMRDQYGVSIAGGQAQLKGKIFRIAQMGYITKDDLIYGLEILEKVLAELGYKFGRNIGVKKFKEMVK